MQVNLHVAKATLSSLIVEALNGNEVVITKSGKPLVKIVPIDAVMQPRKLGAYKDQGFNLGAEINAGDNEVATLFNEEGIY
ncbi:MULTISPECIES: type II toxin-antitoxin system Phd/YefM family antitoxin [Pseudomonadati]|uniref:Type II toxin-antitoxin system prevent-host-death family antitoxin n=1 Tax=Shewanella aestuarii TaxID=1028752 RepID=A0ABT0L1J7_9GAMM|nr:type II toxin-antitoxin system prevent-host-death family antitoxin [Shewanella aestuarii]MCL1117106.1 type II toxin-antitoxin system prevent-host-death family antitoxin [Shewanella aestuarii]GGN73641.1 hypothetical protein GCM10009193_11810 [Shewanella aestuarii]